MNIPIGTKVSVTGFPAIGGFPAVPSQHGVIVKPCKENLPKPSVDYYLIKFDDGGKLYVHRERFEIVIY